MGKELISQTSAELIARFQVGVRNITALSLATKIPTELSIPHLVVDSFKNLAAIGLNINYQFAQLKGA